MEHTQEQIINAINLFMHLLTQEYAKHFEEKGYSPAMTPPTFKARIGSKNAKIVQCELRGLVWKESSVYCFIALNNGDILKAAGWNAPAKGARGNIFNDDCDVGKRATVYGSGLYIR